MVLIALSLFNTHPDPIILGFIQTPVNYWSPRTLITEQIWGKRKSKLVSSWQRGERERTRTQWGEVTAHRKIITVKGLCKIVHLWGLLLAWIMGKLFRLLTLAFKTWCWDEQLNFIGNANYKFQRFGGRADDGSPIVFNRLWCGGWNTDLKYSLKLESKAFRRVRWQHIKTDESVVNYWWRKIKRQWTRS